MRNSEQQKCFSEVTGTSKDLCSSVPTIKCNIPYVNVLLGERFKFRAMIDSGATSTLISSGLYNMLTGFHLHPSSFKFFGISPDAMQFTGIIYDMPIRFGDNLLVKEDVGVYEHPRPSMIVGNSTVGGVNAKLGIVALCAY